MSSRPAKRGCGASESEYVCVDGTRLAATNASAIEHDRRVRALIDAAQRLASFVPADVAMSDYVTERIGRSVRALPLGKLVQAGERGHWVVFRGGTAPGKYKNRKEVRKSTLRACGPYRSWARLQGCTAGPGPYSLPRNRGLYNSRIPGRILVGITPSN